MGFLDTLTRHYYRSYIRTIYYVTYQIIVHMQYTFLFNAYFTLDLTGYRFANSPDLKTVSNKTKFYKLLISNEISHFKVLNIFEII